MSTDYYSGSRPRFFGVNRETLRHSYNLKLDELEKHDYIGDRMTFKPQYANYQSKVWGRLVKSVKRVPHSLMGQKVLDDEILCILLV